VNFSLIGLLCDSLIFTVWFLKNDVQTITPS